MFSDKSEISAMFKIVSYDLKNAVPTTVVD